MPRPDYGAHEYLVAPARPGRSVWRFLAGLVIIAAVVFGLNALANSMIHLLAPQFWQSEFANPDVQGGRPLSMVILLGSFSFAIVGVGVAARLMQKRALLGLIGPFPLALVQFWQVFRILALLGLILFLLPPWGMGVPLESNLAISRWLLLLPVSVGVVLIQVASEEILFRGYIQQSLAARWSSPLIWMVLPSALFALGHYMPTEAGDNAMPIVLWAGVFGCLMADLTARAGTLGPAIAVHLFNNIIALLLVALPGALSGLSLYLVPFDMADTGAMRGWLAVDFATMLVTWLAARLALRR